MGVPSNALHMARLADQVRSTLLRTQIDLESNAQAHMDYAQAQSPDVGALATMITDCAKSYILQCQNIVDLMKDDATWQRVLVPLGALGITEADVREVLTPILDASRSLLIAPLDSYGAIEKAATMIIDSINKPDSLRKS